MDKIVSDISNGNVYLLNVDGKTVGTVTVAENHICRLFVLPECQHQGFGKALMDFAEEKIFSSFDTIELDASFPAKRIYLKRGYTEIEYNVIDAANGDLMGAYDTITRGLFKYPNETSFKRFYWQVFGDIAADVIRNNLETVEASIA